MDISAIGRLYASTQTSSVNLSLKDNGSSVCGTSGNTTDDKVTISSEGKTMSGLIGKCSGENILGIPEGTPGATLLEKMENAGNKALKDFNSDFRKRLSENGIDTSVPIELDTGYDGSVVVTNNHPDKEAIEKLLKDNPAICDEYRMADRMLTFAQEIKESLEFQKAYAIDPKAAVEQYSYLFSSRPQGRIVISDEGADFTFRWLMQGLS
jgi:hypothetical protein